MAKNRVRPKGDQLDLVVTHPATPASGDPVRYGQRPGVALVDETAAGKTTIQFDGVFELSVEGIDGSGSSAVAEGDILYYTDADDPVLNKKTTGVRFGYAMGTVGAGATATIPVIVGS